MKFIDPDFIPRETVAAMRGCSVRTIIRWENEGKQPQPYKFGRNCVRYSRRELLAFLEGQTTRADTSAA